MDKRIDQAKRGRTPWLAVTVRIGGEPKTVSLHSGMSAVLAAVGFSLAAWYLGATLYYVFHDQLLAALITRQTEAQYAYEDRIAGLSVQLDRETSRSLLDRHLLETKVHDLEERSSRLASRTALIDRLLSRRASASSFRNPLLSGRTALLPDGVRAYADPEPPPSSAVTSEAPALRLGEEAPSSDPVRSDRSPSGGRAEATIAPTSAAATSEMVAARLSATERKQEQVLAALREPTFRLVTKLRTALLDAGVSAGTLAQSSDTGGPFVPLPAAAMSFEQSAALVQDALLQADQLSAMVDKVPLRQPVPGTLEVTSSFGPRIDPFLGRPAMHTGIDFREPYGEAVHATAAGTVTIAAADGGYGTLVEVNHGNGMATRYAHLSSTSVVPGQQIAAGAIVGHVGSTGRATGPHLHYETRVNGEAVDPTRFLKVGARLFEARLEESRP